MPVVGSVAAALLTLRRTGVRSDHSVASGAGACEPAIGAALHPPGEGWIWQSCPVDKRLLPVSLGVGAGLVQFAAPESLGFLIVIIAAIAAGWSMADEPMKAAVLFLLPTILLGAARLLFGDASVSAGVLVLALVVAVMFTAIFTHLGAGIALRRRGAAQRG